MNDRIALPEAPVRARRLSWIWVIPVASLALGGWLLWTTLSRRGPMVDVTLKAAEGLKAGQSEVRYKDVPLGTLDSFDLTPDRANVVMHIRMSRKAEALLTEDARFWVVKPRLFAGDITGLNTIVSGTYIEMSPGDETKPARRAFTGLNNPPAMAAGSQGRLFHLTTPRIGSLNVGSPVFFRALEVGKVVGSTLVGMAESVRLDVFIDAPYDQWVHDDSQFWSTSGIRLNLDASGVQLQVDSLKSAFLGGVAFDTPAGPLQPSAGERSFALFANAATAEAATDPERHALATYLEGSVGGLAPGAPVMLMGMRVGEVTTVQLQVDTDRGVPRVRVGFVVLPDKVAAVGGRPAPHFPEGFRTLVQAGLRTSLKGGNLITGQKQLALEIDADAPKAEAVLEGDVVIIPANGNGGGGIEELSATASQVLAKIGKMPFEQIGQNLNGSLQGVNSVVNGKPLKDALVRLSGTLASTQLLVRNLDAGSAPALRRLPAIAAELQDTLAQVRTLAGSVSAGSAGNGRFGRNLDLVLNQVGDAAVSVRQVADLLAQHPEALIRGRTARAVE